MRGRRRRGFFYGDLTALGVHLKLPVPSPTRIHNPLERHYEHTSRPTRRRRGHQVLAIDTIRDQRMARIRADILSLKVAHQLGNPHPFNLKPIPF